MPLTTLLPVPDLAEILAAKNRIRPHLAETPLHVYSGLNELIGAEVAVKHENCQPVGAFKVRGGINLVSQLSTREREAGLITASTGNHGQSIAFASRIFGVKARIVVPEKANPGKVAAMEGLGAELIFHGPDFDAAKAHCEALADSHGYRYINSGDEPHLIAGVATEALEMLEARPDLEVIIVPIGGGSGAAGCCLAAKALKPGIQVIGVQAEASPAAYETWKQGKMVELPSHTMAEGLATGAAFHYPQAIMAKYLDDFMLVTEGEISQAVFWYLEKAHTLAEGAGAATLALAYKIRDRLAGKKVGIICSGGNLSMDQLKMVVGVD
jgi:threonine dehydratase